MLEWIVGAIITSSISEGIKSSDKRKDKKLLEQHKMDVARFTPSKPSAKYQNRGKQMMYEVYLKDLKENPQWAAFKVKHNQYGGYVFDGSEN